MIESKRKSYFKSITLHSQLQNAHNLLPRYVAYVCKFSENLFKSTVNIIGFFSRKKF